MATRLAFSRKEHLRASYEDEAYCVKCGDRISYMRVCRALDSGVAPCCIRCQEKVRDHLADPGSATWPGKSFDQTPWFGGWTKNVADDTWIQETPRAET